MKLINLTILTLSLLILSNAQSTEENPPSEESTPSDDTSASGESEEPTENPESSSPSGDEDGQSSEPPSDGDSTPQSDDQDQPQDQEDSKNDKPEKSDQPSAKGSYSATYSEIGKILDGVDFKSIEDLHLQRMLENTFQARLRNPIRSQTGQIADFSAIKSCFGKLGGGVKKLINAAKNKFKTCKTGGGNSSGCSDEQENTFADGVIDVATTLQGCISSQRKD